MARMVPLFLAAFFLFPAAAFSADIPAESKLTEATVYTSRATLTRRAVVDVPAGAHSVVFEGLPADLLPDSLRAEGSAAAAVTFGAVAYKQVMSADLAADREQALTDQLEALGDQRNAVMVEKQALATRKEFLDNIGREAQLRANEDYAAIDLKPEQWSTAADTIYKGIGEILQADLVQNIKVRDLDRQIQKVQNELNQIRTGNRSTYQVSVPLEAKAATRLTIDLSYQVPDASWRPVYDARLETESGALELIQYGAVRQNTGEDWTGVALTLSTARPQQGAGLPDLEPMWVSILEQMVMGESRGMMNKAAMAPATMEMQMLDTVAGGGVDASYAAADIPVEAVFQGAEIDTGGFVSAYRIPGPSTVAADGTESKLLIGPFETDNKLEIQLKPQLSSEAFLVAMATLKGDAPILPGTVNLFRDGAYIGQTYAPLLRPGEKYNLAFGTDDQVSLRRSTLKDERSEAGLISKDNVLERHFVSAIKNLHNKKVDVVVLETIPVPQDERIKAEILAAQTTAGYDKDVDDKKGLLRWTVPMEAKAETDVKLGWTVSWPKDAMISGL